MHQVTAQSKNMEAFEAWMSEHENYAYRFAFSILMHRQDAQDAVSEAFYKLFKMDILNRLENPKAYLLTTVHRCCFDILRKRKRLVLLGDINHLETMLSQNTQNTMEQSLEIADMLQGLPHDMRTAMVLRYYYDWSYEQITQLLGISTGTLSSRLNRAKQRLKAEARS